MGIVDIVVSANGQDEEPWRIDRLHSFLGALAANLQMVVPALPRIGLVSVRDHKGILTTRWGTYSGPTLYNNEVCRAWDTVGEDRDNVEFHVPTHGIEVVLTSNSMILIRRPEDAAFFECTEPSLSKFFEERVV